MRKLYHIGIFMVLCVIAVSCKKDNEVEIVTLSKAGEEFYFGEKVKVWAGTQGGDNTTVSYKWTATGGIFDGWRTQNLFENLWIAPAQIGEYTVTATADRNGGTSSRSTKLKVTRYFFDEFQSKFAFDGNGWAQADLTNSQIMDNDPLKSRIEITANAVNKSAILRRDLNLAPLNIPFSVRAKLGWKGFFRTGQPIIVSLFFKQPAENTNQPFLREIRWEYYPTVDPATTDSYQIRYETFIPSSGKSTFSTATAVLPAPLPLITPIKGKSPIFKSVADQEKTLAFAIDANNVFTAYVDGTEWFSSNGIKDWLAYCKANYPGFKEPLASRFQISYPGKANANEKGTTGFINSVYITNDGTVLK